MSCTVKACRICLETGTKLYNYNLYELKQYYEQIMTANVVENDGLPCYFCYECAAMLHKFHKFKEKCYIGHKLLTQIILEGPMTLKSVCRLKKQTESLQASLKVVTINQNLKTVTVKKRGFVKDNVIKEPLENDAETVLVSDDDDDYNDDYNDDYDEEIELPPLLELRNYDKNVNINETKIDINIEKTDEDENIVAPKHSSEDNKGVNDIKETIDVEENTSDNKKKRNTKASNKRKITSQNTEKKKRSKKKKVIPEKKCNLNLNNWLMIDLTEEQAIEEFKSRAQLKRYINAEFRCDLCLKSFSKEDMLHRHNILHAESTGPHECRFCRRRFIYKSLLEMHIKQHFIRYKCLRCDLVCPFEQSAMSHEQYHDGVKRKCDHCGTEFKHISTYYTHLRTRHRNEHVCTLCGEAFISQLGLKMHQKKKHVEADTASPQEAKEEHEFCERCNIKFETKKAYDEHLLHSVMHLDGIENSEARTHVVCNRKKVRPFIPRRSRKPTDCHICGKHFETQMAARKHKLAEHPRSSFFAPNERIICEICGVSLVPSSVQGHLNSHTKEKKFACDTCGRQFMNKRSLIMHLMTHSSEKTLPCPKCGARFKQYSSMRAHYRTVHLKQPKKRAKTRQNKEFQEIPLFEDFSEYSKD